MENIELNNLERLSEKALDNKLKKYVLQRWVEKEYTTDWPMDISIANSIRRGLYVCVCLILFRKKGTKKTEGSYGSNTHKIKDESSMYKAIDAMFLHAKTTYGFNWKDFEVLNVKTQQWEIATCRA